MRSSPARRTEARHPGASAPRRRWRGLGLRCYRALVLVGILAIVHRYHRWIELHRDAPAVRVDEVVALVPEAAGLGPVESANGLRPVLDLEGRRIASVLTTSPQADHVIGYGGPTNCLVALDNDGRILGVRVLESDDTVEHVNRVLGTPGFFERFIGWNPRLESSRDRAIEAVSGATLTSGAIVRAVSERLGGNPGESMLFRSEPAVADVAGHFPDAAALVPEEAVPGAYTVVSEDGRTIGRVIRTSPVSDPVTGYRGPSDSIVFLDTTGTVTGFRVLESYDTPQYVEDLRYDPSFFRAFNGMTIDEVAGIIPESAGIEGVSGATMTSRALARGIIDRMQSLTNQAPARDARMAFGVHDFGTVALVVVATVVAFTRWRGDRRLRWVLRLLVIGFLGLGAGNLLAQSLLVGWSRAGIPWVAAPGLVLLAAAALVLPLATGRNVYCHHLCPHGAAQETINRLSRFRSVALPRWADPVLRAVPGLTLAAVIVLALLPIRFNFAAIEPFNAYVIAVAGTATIVVALAGLAASFFFKLPYCKFGCPTGALLEFLRSGGSADRFRRRDAVAGVLLALAILLYSLRSLIA